MPHAMRRRFHRRLVVWVALCGMLAFFPLMWFGPSGNHGVGPTTLTKYSSNDLLLGVVGRRGFLTCWCACVVAEGTLFIRHRRGLRRLSRQAKSRRLSAGPECTSFRLFRPRRRS